MYRRTLLAAPLAVYLASKLSAADLLKTQTKVGVTPLDAKSEVDQFSKLLRRVSSSPLIEALEKYRDQLKDEANVEKVVLGYRPTEGTIEFQLRWNLVGATDYRLVQARLQSAKNDSWILGDPNTLPRVWINAQKLDLDAGVLPRIVHNPTIVTVNTLVGQGLITHPLRAS